MAAIGHVGIMILCIFGLLAFAEAQLTMNFYNQSCPKAEDILKEFVEEHMKNAPSLAAALLRMHFHDCFIRGCDGSILLNSTATTNETEKTHTINNSLRGFDFIDRVKSLLEAECPGIVSCADIVALVARDATVATGGPSWNVLTGRRDGLISNATEASYELPHPLHNITDLIRIFGNHGLNLTDLVVLSGAHTVGIAHCVVIKDRLYNFTGAGDEDPSLDQDYALYLKQKCKNSSDYITPIEMDYGSSMTFDLHYYTLLRMKRGFFYSDAALTSYNLTNAMINQLLQGSLQDYFAAFASSMEKMGQMQVKTGLTGEVRKKCASVN